MGVVNSARFTTPFVPQGVPPNHPFAGPKGDQEETPDGVTTNRYTSRSAPLKTASTLSAAAAWPGCFSGFHFFMSSKMSPLS